MQELKRELRALLQTEKEGIQLSNLNNEFEYITGNSIDLNGYKNLESFLRSIPDTVIIREFKGKKVVYYVPDKKTEHIAKLVQGQKSNKSNNLKKKRNIDSSNQNYNKNNQNKNDKRNSYNNNSFNKYYYKENYLKKELAEKRECIENINYNFNPAEFGKDWVEEDQNIDTKINKSDLQLDNKNKDFEDWRDTNTNCLRNDRFKEDKNSLNTQTSIDCFYKNKNYYKNNSQDNEKKHDDEQFNYYYNPDEFGKDWDDYDNELENRYNQQLETKKNENSKISVLNTDRSKYICKKKNLDKQSKNSEIEWSTVNEKIRKEIESKDYWYKIDKNIQNNINYKGLIFANKFNPEKTEEEDWTKKYNYYPENVPFGEDWPDDEQSFEKQSSKSSSENNLFVNKMPLRPLSPPIIIESDDEWTEKRDYNYKTVDFGDDWVEDYLETKKIINENANDFNKIQMDSFKNKKKYSNKSNIKNDSSMNLSLNNKNYNRNSILRTNYDYIYNQDYNLLKQNSYNTQNISKNNEIINEQNRNNKNELDIRRSKRFDSVNDNNENNIIYDKNKTIKTSSIKSMNVEIKSCTENLMSQNLICGMTKAKEDQVDKLSKLATSLGFSEPLYEYLKFNEKEKPLFIAKLTINDLRFVSFPGFFCSRKDAERKVAEQALNFIENLKPVFKLKKIKDFFLND